MTRSAWVSVALGVVAGILSAPTYIFAVFLYGALTGAVADPNPESPHPPSPVAGLPPWIDFVLALAPVGLLFWYAATRVPGRYRIATATIEVAMLAGWYALFLLGLRQ